MSHLSLLYICRARVMKNGQKLKEKLSHAILNSRNAKQKQKMANLKNEQEKARGTENSDAEEQDEEEIEGDEDAYDDSEEEIDSKVDERSKSVGDKRKSARNNKHDASNGTSKPSKVKEVDSAGDATSMMDQGYTRPRILILCPFRSSALQAVTCMIDILGKGRTKVLKMDKFLEEFGVQEGAENEEEDDDNKKKDRTLSRPKDWSALFDEKKYNVDDDFKIGVQVSPGFGYGTGEAKGALLRLFSDFYQSDIIIASPLGLRLCIDLNNEKNVDFLSSLEIVYVSQADVLMQQNWDHVEYILQHINQLPTRDHDVDFSRIRPYFLNGNAKNHRQLVISSAFNDPCIQALWRQHSSSVSGSVRFKKSWGDGCLHGVTSQIQQIFQRVECKSLEDQNEAKFAYFKDMVLMQLLRISQSHTLIMIPSYLDYVRVRNYLLKQDVSKL